MNEPAHSFLYRVWPYLALTLAAAGFVVRMLLTSDRLPAVRRALPRAQRLWVGGWPWRLGWALLVAAHLAGLLFPRAILAWTRTPGRLLALEALGFAVGLAALAACIRAAWQHMRRAAARRLVAAVRLRGFGVPVVAVHRRRVGVARGRHPPLGLGVGFGDDGALRGVAGARAPGAGLRRAPAVPGSPAPVRGVRGASPRSRPAGWLCSRWCGRTARSRSRAARSPPRHGPGPRGCAARRRRGSGRSGKFAGW